MLLFLIIILLSIPTNLCEAKYKTKPHNYIWYKASYRYVDIYYPKGYKLLAHKTGKISENAVIKISKLLRHKLKHKIPIVLYPNTIDFSETNITEFLIEEGILGFTEIFKGRVVIPFTGNYEEFHHTLIHEIIHFFQYDILGLLDTDSLWDKGETLSRIPLWFLEGMSEYLSEGYSEETDEIMRNAVIKNTLPTIEELSNLQIRNFYFVYKGGASIIKFIVEKHSYIALTEILKDIKYSIPFEEAIKDILGYDIKKLSTLWQNYLRKKYYPIVKGKNFIEEIGDTIEEVLEEENEPNFSFKIHPALSYDGKYLAYITIHHYYPTLKILDLQKKDIILQITAGKSAYLLDFHILKNRLSFTKNLDIAFVGRNYNKYAIFIYSIKQEKFLKIISFKKIENILYPYITPSGKNIVFIGQTKGKNGIFLYNLQSKKLKSFLIDTNTKLYPVLLEKQKKILFLGKYEEHLYIYSIDIETGKTKKIFGDGEDITYIIPSMDEKKLFYISNISGIPNLYLLYLHTLSSKQITNILSNVKEIAPNNNTGDLFLCINNIGYQIYYIRKEKINPIIVDKKKLLLEGEKYRKEILSNIKFEKEKQILLKKDKKYRGKLSVDYSYITLFLAGSSEGVSIGGFYDGKFSDIIANNELHTSIAYFSEIEITDINLEYTIRKYKYNTIITLFHHKNPFLLLFPSNLNEFLYTRLKYIYSLRYGGGTTMQYPLSRYLSINLGILGMKIKDIYTYKEPIEANNLLMSLSINYDNSLISIYGPISGRIVRIEFSKSIKMGNEYLEYGEMFLEIREHILITKRHTLAIRGIYGKRFGSSSDLLRYEIGGFNTIRGHPLFAYQGKNVLLLNIEFRFPLLDLLLIAFPFRILFPPVRGVLFFDIGATFDDEFIPTYDDGKFRDLKAGFGFGIRFFLLPNILIRIDFATPYDGKNSLPLEKWQGIFSLGMEF